MFNAPDCKMLIELLNGLPNPAQLYAPNGDLLMANHAFIDEFNIIDPEELVQKYNLINDPTAKAAPFYDTVLKAFSGVTTQYEDVIIPIHQVKSINNISGDSIKTLVADISTVPICEDGHIIYVVNLLFIKRRLCNRREIDAAKAYIEMHWMDKFDIEHVAGIVYLSTSYFAHIFKSYTGITPHDYYIDVKIEKIKDKLLDMNLSVDEAFASCGVDYHGHYAALFKKKTGFTPSEYRRFSTK